MVITSTFAPALMLPVAKARVASLTADTVVAPLITVPP